MTKRQEKSTICARATVGALTRKRRRGETCAAMAPPMAGRAHVGDHLDGERRAEDEPGVRPREVEGEKAEGDCRQARPDEGKDLRGEEVAIGRRAERCEHGPVLVGGRREGVDASPAGGGAAWRRRNGPRRRGTGGTRAGRAG